jgi:hypothetical protein
LVKKDDKEDFIMAELSFKDKAKEAIQTNAVAIVIFLVAVISYLVVRMKKRNVKLLGR